jgi:serine/threonine protein kinase
MTRCPRCGAPAPPRGQPQSLCPGCLIASLFQREDEADAGEQDDTWFDIPYQIVTLIARHADGATYLATPIGAANHVALRIIGPLDDVPAVLNRARTWKPELAQVRDPHIARLLDAGPAADGCIYVAAEFIGGPTLALPACRERLTAADRHAVVAQLGAAIAALHVRGLTHLTLAASRVKIGERDGIHATLIGLGEGLIIEGLQPDPAQDRRALASLARELGVDL